MSNIIKIQNLTKNYDKGSTIALDDVTMDIEDGVSLSIIGPSGSGKSTLLNMIGALDTSDSGQIEITGKNISQIKNLNKFRRETVGFVFQLHNLIPNLSSSENVELPMFGTGIKSAEMEKKADESFKISGTRR